MSNKKETIEQIVDLLRSLVDDEPETEEVKPAKKRATKKKTTLKKSSTARTKKTTPAKTTSSNKFDSMPERNMFRDDIAIDKKLSIQPPSPRTRSFNTIEVTCRSCGKSEKVNPSLVHEPTRYKCNTCSRSGG
jgi:excinuclease UvrABC ATPase subunit